VGGWHTCGDIQHTYGTHHFRLGKTRLVFHGQKAERTDGTTLKEKKSNIK
jgi:hypothetical protein